MNLFNLALQTLSHSFKQATKSAVVSAFRVELLIQLSGQEEASKEDMISEGSFKNKMAYTANDPCPPHDVFCFNS